MTLKQPVTLSDLNLGVTLTLHGGVLPHVDLRYQASEPPLDLSAKIALDHDQTALADLADVMARPGAPELEEQRRRFANFPRRAGAALPHVAALLRATVRWLMASREDTNYTYDLTPQNKLHLAHLLAVVTGRNVTEMRGYMAELEDDAALAGHIAAAHGAQAPAARAVAGRSAHYARRIGWYALVRAMRPRLVVETGVDKGLGSVVLCAALLRNGAAGTPGRYLGTDIRREAGVLLSGRYAEVGRILYGDSVTSLAAIADQIDLFINDSDHSADYEEREYAAIADRLRPQALVLGDNAHVTDRLAAFAEATGRRFVFFREQPANHFYPGAGIGIAFR